MLCCQVCGARAASARLVLGPHPISSHFRAAADALETMVDIALWECEACGAVQLETPPTVDALLPPKMFQSREPEAHLDDTVARILDTPGLPTGAVVAGVTYKDDTTLDRFAAKGFQTWRLDLAADFNIHNPRASIETIQAVLTPQTAAPIRARRGAADLVICRHTIEHAHNLSAFVSGMAALVKPGGLLMLEFPDCTTSLTLGDVAMVWEEHTLYFTPETFAQAPALGGCDEVWRKVYPLPFENPTVFLCRKAEGAPKPAQRNPGSGVLAAFSEKVAAHRAAYRAKLEAWGEEGGVALFGAGHLACHFVNFYGPFQSLAAVLDDTPEKQGKYLPGAPLPIHSSERLRAGDIATVLFAVSIQNEDQVLTKNPALAEFVARGGRLRSIFEASPRSLSRESPA